MAKNSKSKPIQNSDLDLDALFPSEQTELWDIEDPHDRAFWDEFFKIEEMLSITDELDPPSFTISVQNDQTGELKTYSNIHLAPSRKKIIC